MSHHYKLYYFNIMGRAEPARILFAYKGVKYEDFRIEYVPGSGPGADWAALKPKMPFGQVPVLEVDGKMLSQTQAINRYLGRTFGMTGANDWEAAQCDMLVDGMTDVQNNLRAWFMEKDEEKKKQVWTAFENEHLKPFYTLYEKFLKTNGTGHFVGKTMTWADIVLFGTMSWFDHDHPHILKAYPELTKFVHMVSSEPKIKHWIETRPKTSM